jgi:sulfur carrier protein ThiS
VSPSIHLPSRILDVNVSVTLFADLRRFGPQNHEGAIAVSLDDGASVEELLTAVGFPDDETIRGEITVGLNGDLGKRDTVLNDGDDVTLFSPMEGGSTVQPARTDEQ